MSMHAYRNDCKLSLYLITTILNGLYQQQMPMTEISTKIETFKYIRALFSNIANDTENLSENEKVNRYAQLLKTIQKELQSLFRQVESKMKMITSTLQVRDWVDQVREFLEKMYVDKATSQVQKYISGFVNLLRLKRIGQESRVNSFTQQSSLKRHFSELKEINRIAIDVALAEVENRERVIFHIKIKAMIQMRLEDIFRNNYDALKAIVNSWKIENLKENAKKMHSILKKEFKELTLSVFTIIDSKFRNCSVSQSVDNLSKEIQQLLNQSEKNMPLIRLKFLALYEQSKKTLLYDIRNNLSKTFCLQFTKNDQLRYKVALSQTQKFDFKFTFVNNLDVYIKNYHSWYRGKQEAQNKIMYKKHWSIINYFVLTIPHGIVQYFQASEDQADKTMKFIMERGQRSFTNFQQGYAYFTSLSVEGKIRLILDLAESLIILQQHGINHNDITIRNTVPIKGAFKLIDFDVARMFDVDFDASSYPPSSRQQIKEYRSQIIRLTKALMKMQLKQERIISKSDANKPSVQVENINRLSEYYFLPNENLILKMLKNNPIYQKNFSREERLNLIIEYESYILGKKDCNKFGLMVLKLLYQGRQKQFTQFLNSRIDQFIKSIQRRPFVVDYKKLVTYFKLDTSIDEDTNIEILKLLSQLFEPQMHKRIPMKLFYFKFLRILRISQYRIIVKPFKPKEALPRQINPDFLNLQTCMLEDINTGQRRQLLQKIQQLFNITIKIAKDHYQQYAKISQPILSSLSNPNNIIFTSSKVKNYGISSRSLMIINDIAEKNKSLVKYAWEVLKKVEEMICQRHGLKIQAECEEPNCPQRWLCSKCLYTMLFYTPLDSELAHFKRIISSGKITVVFHPIAYIGSSRRHRVDVVCMLVQGETYNFKCVNCLDQTKDLSRYDNIYFINWKNRIIYDPENTNNIETDSTIPYNFPTRFKNYCYKDIFQNLTVMKDIILSKNESIFDNLRTGKSMLDERFKEFGRTYAEITEMVERNSKISKIFEILQYMKMRPNLLKELRKHQDNLKTYFRIIKLDQIAKLINSNKDINLLDYCEYFIDRIRETFEDIYQKTNKIYEDGRKNRERHVISNRRLFESASFIRQVFKQKNEKTVSKLQPNGLTMKIRQHMETLNSIKPIPKQNQSLLQSKIQVPENDDSHMMDYNKADYDICYCKKKNEAKSHQKIKYFCTAEECSYRFMCQSCVQYHDKDHQNSRLELCYNQKEEDNQQIDFLMRKIDDLNQSLKVNKVLEKIIGEVRIDMVDPIDFITELYNHFDQTERLKKIVLQKLKKLIMENKVKEYGDYLWIISHYLSNPQQFMKVLKFQTERYISCLIQTKRGIQALYNNLAETQKVSIEKNTNEQSYFTPYNQEQSEKLFDERYMTINDFSFQNVLLPLQSVTARHHKRVQYIQIKGIKQSNDLNSLEVKSKNQFKKKLEYNHYNNFDIFLYCKNFRASHSSFLSKLQNFQNLKKLSIVDEPNWARPIAFKSIQIQQMLVKVNHLQELKLHCLNGFDRYCLEIIKKRHHNCVVDIDSSTGKVSEWKWMNKLFQKEPYIDLPFSIDGELLSPFSTHQIVRGEYFLSLTDQTIKETMLGLTSLKKIPANHLKMIFNTLLEHDRLDDPFTFFEVKINFWCRITYGTSLTIKLQEQINKRCSAVKIIFPQFNKFAELKSLTLHGLIVNAGDSNPYAQQVQTNLKQSLSSLKLQTLELVKCIGLKISAIFQNIYTLKRLIIQQCAFKQQNVDNLQNYPSFVQLQTLIMRRVGLFEIDSKNRLLSRQLASYLGRFNITTLSILILNDFYELENKQLEWIQKCPIKMLSLRRCFKITSDIYMLTMRIKELQDFDITDTDIQESSFRHKNTGDGKQRLRLYNSVHKITSENVESMKVMKELSRIANSYHIQQMQKVANLDVEQQIKASLMKIKEITLQNLKIREKGQYYIMEILGKLPDLEVLSIINCEWKNRLKTESIKYGQFTFIKELQKLKELSLVNANIKKISSSWINSYKYLRKLVLSHNPYLDQICDLEFGELKELDISNTGVKNINLNFQKLSTILYINLQNTKLSIFPQQLLLSKTIRIIVTSLIQGKNEGATNFRKHDSSDLKPIIRLQEIETMSQFFDKKVTELQDIIQTIEALQDKKGNIYKTKSQTSYIDSCICVDNKQAVERIKNISCRTLLRFQFFKVEMEVKGIFTDEKISKFYEQQQQREQWKSQEIVKDKQWKEDMLYELMTFQSELEQSQFVYIAFSLKNSQRQTPIDQFILQSHYNMSKYASQKYNDDYIAAFYPPVREYKDKPFSNFIAKRSTQYQPCQKEEIFSKYLEDFLEFLWQCNADMNRRNIMNCEMTFRSIGLCKEHKHSLFKVIDVSKCLLVQTGKDSPLYKILQLLILNNKTDDLYKRSLESFQQLLNLRSTIKNNDEIKKFFLENVVAKFKCPTNVAKRLAQTGKPILNSQLRQELHYHIEDIIDTMQRYKKIVNGLHVINILQELQQSISKNPNHITEKAKILAFRNKMKKYISQLDDQINND